MYQNILSNPEILNKVLINELKEIKKDFATPRRSQIQAEVQSLEIDTHILIPDEQVMVSLTKEGYMKRTSMRSFASSDLNSLGLRDFWLSNFCRGTQYTSRISHYHFKGELYPYSGAWTAWN